MAESLWVLVLSTFCPCLSSSCGKIGMRGTGRSRGGTPAFGPPFEVPNSCCFWEMKKVIEVPPCYQLATPILIDFRLPEQNWDAIFKTNLHWTSDIIINFTPVAWIFVYHSSICTIVQVTFLLNRSILCGQFRAPSTDTLTNPLAQPCSMGSVGAVAVKVHHSAAPSNTPPSPSLFPSPISWSIVGSAIDSVTVRPTAAPSSALRDNGVS